MEPEVKQACDFHPNIKQIFNYEEKIRKVKNSNPLITYT